MRNLTLTVCALVIVAGLSQSVMAATITWGTQTAISGPSDVVTGLFTLDNIMFSNNNANASETVNGVTFLRAVSPTTNQENSVAGNIKTSQDNEQNSQAPTTGNLAYDGLLSRESYTDPGSIKTITISGLEIGAKYAIQAWVDDFDHGTAQNSLTLNYGQPGAVDVISGNYIVGTFFANATTQTLTWGSGDHYNTFDAMQVQFMAPEPSSLLLCGLGVAGLFIAARRRRKA